MFVLVLDGGLQSDQHVWHTYVYSNCNSVCWMPQLKRYLSFFCLAFVLYIMFVHNPPCLSRHNEITKNTRARLRLLKKSQNKKIRMKKSIQTGNSWAHLANTWQRHFFRPRSLTVCLSVCMSVCLSACGLVIGDRSLHPWESHIPVRTGGRCACVQASQSSHWMDGSCSIPVQSIVARACCCVLCFGEKIRWASHGSCVSVSVYVCLSRLFTLKWRTLKWRTHARTAAKDSG